jgi:hypothetical protein
VAIGVNASTSSGDIASTTATTTITKPAGTASTDVLVVTFGTDIGGIAAAIVTAPSGWTAINTALAVTNGNSNVRLAAFWALDNTTPIDATAAPNSSSSATTLTTNAVTVATSGAWHCIPCIDWNGSATDMSAPGFTTKQNASAQANATLLYNATSKPAGSTGTVVVTSVSSATGQIIAAMPFALRPAGAGAAFVARRPYALGQAVPRAAFY